MLCKTGTLPPRALSGARLSCPRPPARDRDSHLPESQRRRPGTPRRRSAPAARDPRHRERTSHMRRLSSPAATRRQANGVERTAAAQRAGTVFAGIVIDLGRTNGQRPPPTTFQKLFNNFCVCVLSGAGEFFSKWGVGHAAHARLNSGYSSSSCVPICRGVRRSSGTRPPKAAPQTDPPPGRASREAAGRS